MTVTLRVLSLAIFAVPAFVASGAAADPAASNKSGLSASALSPSALSNDPLVRQSQSDDLSERVDALESSRATVDQKSKSPISLSISGWVDQQITYTRQ